MEVSVDKHQMVDVLITEAKKRLSPKEMSLARHFFLFGETELAIEFLCDLFIEHKVVFSENFCLFPDQQILNY